MVIKFNVHIYTMNAIQIQFIQLLNAHMYMRRKIQWCQTIGGTFFYSVILLVSRIPIDRSIVTGDSSLSTVGNYSKFMSKNKSKEKHIYILLRLTSNNGTFLSLLINYQCISRCFKLFEIMFWKLVKLYNQNAVLKKHLSRF